jgi:hypothetical protein
VRARRDGAERQARAGDPDARGAARRARLRDGRHHRGRPHQRRRRIQPGLRPLSRSPAGSAAEPGRFPRRHRPREALARGAGARRAVLHVPPHLPGAHPVQDPAAPDGPLHRTRRCGRVAAPHGGLRYGPAVRGRAARGLPRLPAGARAARRDRPRRHVRSRHRVRRARRHRPCERRPHRAAARPAPRALSRRGFASARDRRRGRRRPAADDPRAGRSDAAPDVHRPEPVPQLRGEPNPEREIVGEQLWGPRQTSLRDGRHTWITTETGTALYEDATDRWEQRDRAADEPDLAARGRDAIVAFRARCQTEMRELSKAPVPMDPDRLRALKALGYVQ